jgi:hypothetical protein
MMGSIFSSCGGSKRESATPGDDDVAFSPVMRTEAMMAARREDEYRIPIHWSPFDDEPRRRREETVVLGSGGGEDDLSVNSRSPMWLKGRPA